MKIKRNPANPTPVMFPFLRGVYLGATLDPEATRKAGAPRFITNDDEHDLGKDAFARDPKGFAYWKTKVTQKEILAADDEMAKACGVTLAIECQADGSWTELQGDGSGEALPQMAPDHYAPDAKPLPLPTTK